MLQGWLAYNQHYRPVFWFRVWIQQYAYDGEQDIGRKRWGERLPVRIWSELPSITHSLVNHYNKCLVQAQLSPNMMAVISNDQVTDSSYSLNINYFYMNPVILISAYPTKESNKGSRNSELRCTPRYPYFLSRNVMSTLTHQRLWTSMYPT